MPVAHTAPGSFFGKCHDGMVASWCRLSRQARAGSGSESRGPLGADPEIPEIPAPSRPDLAGKMAGISKFPDPDNIRPPNRDPIGPPGSGTCSGFCPGSRFGRDCGKSGNPDLAGIGRINPDARASGISGPGSESGGLEDQTSGPRPSPLAQAATPYGAGTVARRPQAGPAAQGLLGGRH